MTGKVGRSLECREFGDGGNWEERLRRVVSWNIPVGPTGT